MLVNSRLLSVFCIAVIALMSCLPLAAGADDFSIDVSPNIVNIASERVGEIRIFTDMRYSAFVSSASDVFIYINESEESIENIRATRDSRGNLILRFELEDLLALEESLIVDDYNHVEVVVVHEDGEEYASQGEAYLIDKQSR